MGSKDSNSESEGLCGEPEESKLSLDTEEEEVLTMQQTWPKGPGSRIDWACRGSQRYSDQGIEQDLSLEWVYTGQSLALSMFYVLGMHSYLFIVGAFR